MELRVHSNVSGKVPMLVPSLDDEVPGSTADVLQDDHGGLGPIHPVHHAFEGLSRFTSVVQALLLVVEVRVIDTRCPCYQDVAVSGHHSQTPIGSGGLLVTQLTNVTEQQGGLKITRSGH